MFFGSIEFYIFISLLFLIWTTCPHRFRWIVLLVASYIFYFFWKPWYSLILFCCTLTTWFAGKKIAASENCHQKKKLLLIAVAVNLTPLIFFKYFNFCNDSLATVFSFGEIPYIIPHLDILLPVGISFYSFQAISYCVDVYKKKIEPEKFLGYIALYLAFFPKLISGPIERGKALLPQLQTGAPFNAKLLYSGMQLFFWGLFKKVVIADRLAMYVDMVFSHPQDYYGKTVIIAIWLFTLQIYCDFSAYTDMAIGCARIFGIKLSQNFNYPYMARSIAGFWRRWHMTLTSWFMEYMYIPLGGNRVSNINWVFNIVVVFLISGLWHGAAWTFICWGGLHGFYYLFGKITSQARNRLKNILCLRGKLLSTIQVFITFHLVALAWVFFRAETIQDAYIILSHIFTNFSSPIRMMPSQFTTALSWGLALVFIGLELFRYWNMRANHRYTLAIPAAVKYPAYVAILLSISLLGVSSNQFIYFHF